MCHHTLTLQCVPPHTHPPMCATTHSPSNVCHHTLTLQCVPPHTHPPMCSTTHSPSNVCHHTLTLQCVPPHTHPPMCATTHSPSNVFHHTLTLQCVPPHTHPPMCATTHSPSNVFHHTLTLQCRMPRGSSATEPMTLVPLIRNPLVKYACTTGAVSTVFTLLNVAGRIRSQSGPLYMDSIRHTHKKRMLLCSNGTCRLYNNEGIVEAAS